MMIVPGSGVSRVQSIRLRKQTFRVDFGSGRDTVTPPKTRLDGWWAPAAAGRRAAAANVWAGDRRCVCFITAGPITKLFAWGEEESGGHVL
jgi:hypothetical protein